MRTPARGLFAVALFALALAASPLHADTLWYNGDWESDLTGWANSIDGAWGANPGALIYENFNVPTDEIWQVDTLWSNNYFLNIDSFMPDTLHWEIRTGMADGVAGTLLYSADATGSSTTASPTGRWNGQEYTLAVTDLSLTLNPGTYWVAVTPDMEGNFEDAVYCSTTNGLNAVPSSSVNDDIGLLHLPNNYIYDDMETDFSIGVGGTSQPVPEPASIVFWVTALTGAAFGIRKRRTRRN